MKYYFPFLLLMTCTIEDQLNLIRPGSEWQIKSGDYEGIIWMDKTQRKPTRGEMDAAATQCKALVQQLSSNPARDQAILEAKDTSLDVQTRLDALIRALDLK